MILAATLANTDAAAFEHIANHPGLTLWSACVARSLRCGVPPDRGLIADGLAQAAAVLAALDQPGEETQGAPWARASDGVVALGDHPWLREVLGSLPHTAGVMQPRRTLAAYTQALEILETLLPGSASLVRGQVRFIVGVEGPPNIVVCGSTEDLPGLVYFSLTCAPRVVAEELYHEATHIRLEHGVDLSGLGWVWDLPALWSPFTQSVRPAWRLVHGIAAYGALHEMWRQVAERGADALWIDGLPAADAPAWARSRMVRLRSRLSQANAQLGPLIEASEEAALDAVFEALSAPALRTWGQSATVQSKLRGIDFASCKLPDVKHAELLCAIGDQKASRITVPMHQTTALVGLLHGHGHVCFGREAVQLEDDPALGGFSNLIGRSVSLLGEEANRAEVHAYVARLASLARACEERDRSDDAGELMAYPACCVERFKALWPEAVTNWGGDLAALLLADEARDTPVFSLRWQANAVATYFGGGLCWHFPCSSGCASTRRVIEQRLSFLRERAPGLAQRLLALQQRSFFCVPGQAYALIPATPVSRFSELRWTATPELGQALDRSGLVPADLTHAKRWAEISKVVGARWLAVTVEV